MALKADAAVKQVRNSRRPKAWATRSSAEMGVKGSGGSGKSYALEFDNAVGLEDRAFEIDGVRVICDKKSYLYLSGTMLDYVLQGLTDGFTFSATPTPSRAAVVARRSPP